MQAAGEKPRAIVAAVQLSSVSDEEFEASLTELRQLAKTLGFELVGKFTQKRAGFHSAAYFGTGKREELRLMCEQEAVDLVLIDHEISPSQAFNLEKEVGAGVMDRAMVILEIFHRHARSRFARAQVEIARLGYMAPRLREAAKQAGPKDRARSGTGGGSGGVPHGLVASFKSTLDEALEASLLAHVVDASDPGHERQLQVTHDVLDEIGAQEVPRLLVFNKIDRAGNEAALRAKYPGCIVMSARREGDVARLREVIVAFFQRDLVEAELFLPWSAQNLRGQIFATCTVLEERTDGEGAFLRVRGEPEALARLREQLGEAAAGPPT